MQLRPLYLNSLYFSQYQHYISQFDFFSVVKISHNSNFISRNVTINLKKQFS